MAAYKADTHNVITCITCTELFRLGRTLRQGVFCAEAPCASQCTKQVYPNMDDFTDCVECSSKTENIPYDSLDNAGIEIVLLLQYSRKSPLLGAAQPNMVSAFVDLLQERGIKVQCKCQSPHTRSHGTD